jgi:hypothetical protein
MNAKEFVEAFGELSPEDQSTVLKELRAGPEERSESGCCPGPMVEEVKQMLKQMESSGDPMRMCEEMMRQCREEPSSCSS